MGSLEKLTNNAKIPYGTIDKGTAEMIIKNAEESGEKYRIDSRLPAISFIKNADSNSCIYNYSMFFASVMAKDPVIRLYLDFGLIPVAFYPTTHDNFIDEVGENIEMFGLKHFKITARFNHKRKDIHKDMYDSWVSRIEAAKFLNCPPENVKMTELYKKVMNFDAD